MLKYLVIFAVVLGLAFVIARHDEYASLNATQKSTDEHDPTVSAKPNEEKSKDYPHKTAWDSPSGHIFHNTFGWPNGTTVWAIILTLMAIAEQTRETRRAALATERAAEASLGQVSLTQRQIDIGIARERARLSLYIQEPSIDDNYANTDIWIIWQAIEVTNIGHSNAFIRNGAVRFITLEANCWPAPEPSPEEFSIFGSIPPSESPHYLSTKPMEFSGRDFRGFAKKLKSGVLRLHFYGFIEYESMRVVWHRDFGYIWIPNSEDEYIVSRNPLNGRIYLHGNWEQDVRQKNNEYEKPN